MKRSGRTFCHDESQIDLDRSHYKCYVNKSIVQQVLMWLVLDKQMTDKLSDAAASV